MNFPEPSVWMRHRISYGETDAMGVLYYAEYLHIFERARSTYSRACGCSYDEIEKGGIILPVREAQCRYRSPGHYDELIWVQVAISEWKRASVCFAYRMYDEGRNVLLAEGMTEHAVYNREAARPDGVPGWLKEAFSRVKYPDIE